MTNTDDARALENARNELSLQAQRIGELEGRLIELAGTTDRVEITQEAFESAYHGSLYEANALGWLTCRHCRKRLAEHAPACQHFAAVDAEIDPGLETIITSLAPECVTVVGAADSVLIAVSRLAETIAAFEAMPCERCLHLRAQHMGGSCLGTLNAGPGQPEPPCGPCEFVPMAVAASLGDRLIVRGRIMLEHSQALVPK